MAKNHGNVIRWVVIIGLIAANLVLFKKIDSEALVLKIFIEKDFNKLGPFLWAFVACVPVCVFKYFYEF
jgi:hypothetical protein